MWLKFEDDTQIGENWSQNCPFVETIVYDTSGYTHILYIYKNLYSKYIFTDRTTT